MERLRIGLHPAVMEWAPEVTYVFRTLLGIAGYAWEFVPSPEAGPRDPGLDIYYGPDPAEADAPVRIRSAGVPLVDLEGRVPRRRLDRDGLCFLDFTGAGEDPVVRSDRGATFHNDIVLAAFWLLSGAREPAYPRDARDNLDLSGTCFARARLFETPVVSQYGVRLRRLFAGLGREPSPPAWGGGPGEAALLLTHDVDYPEIVRTVEALRSLGEGGAGRLRRALDILAGRVDYWRFGEWVEFAGGLGARPTFFFMARRGSLAQYAAGTPDAFYDVRSERFGRLFRELTGDGCEVGLHPSYHAYRGEERIRRERCRLETAAGVEVRGARHHYWHLDPSAPAETLRLQERSGLDYDSTLGFEYYPGFRRGICHPFRPFHPEERRELKLVELPPTWMDDHFHRRLSENGVEDPEEHALRLLGAVRQVGGTAVLDYHVRGMEGRMYPAYGPWLRRLVESGAARGFEPAQCRDVAAGYRRHAARLEAASAGPGSGEGRPAVAAVGGGAPGDDEPAPAPGLDVGPAREEELPEVACLHCWFFGQGVFRGSSLAGLGPEALEALFYRPNHDNPHFFCDVARWEGRVVGWSVYATDRREVFRHPLRRRPLRLAWEGARALLRRPGAASSLLANLRYLGGDPVGLPEPVDGWWIVAGVRPEYRTPDFERRAGTKVAAALFDRMEARFREAGCEAWYGVVRPDNTAIVRFLERRGAERVEEGREQGMRVAYYVTRCGAPARGAEV